MAVGLRAHFHGGGVRPLGVGATAAVAAVLDRDPVGTCMVGARFESAGMDRRRLGGTFWGAEEPAGGLCFVGANVIPLAGGSAAMWSVADMLSGHPRRVASIIGRAELTLPLWTKLQSRWGPAREVRDDQPLMVCPDAPAVASDGRVTVVTPERQDDYFPAAVAMFTEEVGVDPTAGDGGMAYRSRVAELIGARHAFAVFDGASIVFKAEVGCVTRRVGLIQGVWVHPRWRGTGIAAPATAAVVRAIQSWGRLPCLYVNSFNAAARATYARVGFVQVGRFASVLF